MKIRGRKTDYQLLEYIHKHDKLPPLNNRGYQSPEQGNNKLKELSKVYKVNIGADDYNPLVKHSYKKERYRDHSLKNPAIDNVG